jgi:hypothetical protein
MSADIQILIHDTAAYPDGPSYFALGLRNVWMEMGMSVEVVRGPNAVLDARLVIPHIDMTVTPQPYRKLLEAHPNVLNRGLYDISKRRISAHLLARGDSYAGPVIVKTDDNCGGGPDSRVRKFERSLSQRLVRKLARALGKRPQPRPVQGTDYLIFDSIGQVPEDIWVDDRFVVERFLPEREGDCYYLRWYCFVGDRFRSGRGAAKDPLVKRSIFDHQEVGLPVPPEVVALRESLGLDIGRMDYIMHEGKPIIFDVNTTSTEVLPPHVLADCRPYGPGVLPLLEGKRGPLEYIDVDG